MGQFIKQVQRIRYNGPLVDHAVEATWNVDTYAVTQTLNNFDVLRLVGLTPGEANATFGVELGDGERSTLALRPGPSKRGLDREDRPFHLDHDQRNTRGRCGDPDQL